MIELIGRWVSAISIVLCVVMCLAVGGVLVTGVLIAVLGAIVVAVLLDIVQAIWRTARDITGL